MKDSEERGRPGAIDVCELTALLSEQRDLYQELGRLADRQRSLITAEEPEQLLAVLAQRQKVLDKLTAVADRVRPFQEQWQPLRAGMSAEDGERIDGIVAEMHAMLTSILEKDEADARLLAVRKGATARSMGTLKQGRQAGAAYAASSEEAPRRSDWADA